MDRWEDIEPEGDSTLRVIHEAALRGHEIGILYINDLLIKKNIPYGFFKILKSDKIAEDAVEFYKEAKFNEELLPIKEFNVIFLRKDPPLDYLSLNFLDSIKDEVFTINNIDGVRKANNKLYLTTFKDFDFIPETYISNNVNYLLNIINENPDRKMILKPVAGYGGCGVILLEKSARKNLRSILEFYTNGGRNYVILQEYIEGAEKGDVRVIMLNGEPIGAMRRIPAEDDIRSNIHAGGRAAQHKLTSKEVEICKKIGKKLVEDGLFWAGLDIIENKLIEVNVVSPGGIADIEQLSGEKLQRKVVDFFEEKCSN